MKHRDKDAIKANQQPLYSCTYITLQCQYDSLHLLFPLLYLTPKDSYIRDFINSKEVEINVLRAFYP